MKCDVCFEDIISTEDTLTHVKSHQVQMLSLINRLNLPSSFTPKVTLEECNTWNDSDDTNDSDDSNISETSETSETSSRIDVDESARNPSCHHKQSQKHDPAHVQIRQAQHKKIKCPDPRCKRKKFPRKQELVRHCATHYEIEKVCPSCSTLFTIASKYRTHKCGASAETRRVIRTEYDEIRQDIEVTLGLRKPGLSRKQIEEPTASEKQFDQNPNSSAFSVAIGVGEGAEASLDLSESTTAREQSASVLSRPGPSSQCTNIRSHTDHTQLYSLFDDIPGLPQPGQPQELLLLWDEFDSSNVFLLSSQDRDISEVEA